jgi:flagellar biosynthesis chaperone FliJ
MSVKPIDPAADADCLRNALSEIRASRNEFHALISGTLANLERTGDELLTRTTQKEHEAADQQITRLTTVIAELTEFLANHKRMVAEERMDWANEMRHVRAQFESLQQKQSDFAQRQEGTKGRSSSEKRSPETSCR